MKVSDQDLLDVLFLDKHPSWTYHDLMGTPEIVIATMRLLDEKRA